MKQIFKGSSHIKPSKKFVINDENDLVSLTKLNKIFSSFESDIEIHNQRFINKHLELINSKLIENGIFIGKCKVSTYRTSKIIKKYPIILNYLIYFLDFFFNRIIAKLSFTKRLYFFITKGKNRVISKAEILGRLYSCGFNIIEEKEVGETFHFMCEKVDEPTYDNKPTYGAIIGLKRVGKNGKVFNAYKLRTMSPYSEYIQDYLYKKNNLQKGGKFKDDFRISKEAKILRKYWIDELPMIYNLITGDVKLVGVRPLSEHYFNLYSEDLKKLRINSKPGLIPPYYADLPKNFEDIMKSELTYLNRHRKNPIITDLIYFFKILKNILLRGVRSE